MHLRERQFARFCSGRTSGDLHGVLEPLRDFLRKRDDEVAVEGGGGDASERVEPVPGTASLFEGGESVGDASAVDPSVKRTSNSPSRSARENGICALEPRSARRARTTTVRCQSLSSRLAIESTTSSCSSTPATRRASQRCDDRATAINHRHTNLDPTGTGAQSGT